MDFRRYIALSEFDHRGARIEWEEMTVKVKGEIFEAVAFNAPEWVTKSLKPHLEFRGAKRVKLKKNTDYWLESYILPGGFDTELLTLFDLLASVRSVDRALDHVDICLALDLYKTPEDGVEPTEWQNTEAGELVYRSKYWNRPEAFREIAVQMVRVFTDHPDYRSVDAIVSVPGSSGTTESHGERLARAVARKAGIAFVRTRPTYKTRPSSKEGFTLTTDHVSIPTSLDDQRVAIVDDVCRSGHSIDAVAEKARSHGAASVVALIAAKTLRN